VAYGLPENINNIIRSFYTGSQSTVRVNVSLGEWCEVISGVWQGCVLSPLLFTVEIDWAMKWAVETASRSGLKWTKGDNVTDLDFAVWYCFDRWNSWTAAKAYKFGSQLRKENRTWHKCGEDKMYEDRPTGSYVAIESQQTAGWVCQWILLSCKHNNRHWQLWQRSQNMYRQSKFSLQETRWYTVPEMSMTSIQNSAMRVTGVCHIAILCGNMATHRSKQEASWRFPS